MCAEPAPIFGSRLEKFSLSIIGPNVKPGLGQKNLLKRDGLNEPIENLSGRRSFPFTDISSPFDQTLGRQLELTD
jgi:hypothetical protein